MSRFSGVAILFCLVLMQIEAGFAPALSGTFTLLDGVGLKVLWIVKVDSYSGKIAVD